MAEDDGSGLDLGQDIVGHDDLDELENQLMGQSEQSKDVESEMNGILDGLKEASELDDGSLLGSQNKGVGNFLQKFEHKATKKSGLLNQDGPIMDLRGRFGDELGGERDLSLRTNPMRRLIPSSTQATSVTTRTWQVHTRTCTAETQAAHQAGQASLITLTSFKSMTSSTKGLKTYCKDPTPTRNTPDTKRIMLQRGLRAKALVK
jgi:hypothetical protein